MREAPSHGDTMQLNEWACLQWNLGRSPREGGDSYWLAINWELSGSWLAAERPSVGKGSSISPILAHIQTLLAEATMQSANLAPPHQEHLGFSILLKVTLMCSQEGLWN